MARKSLLDDESGLQELAQGSMDKLAPSIGADEPASPEEETAMGIALHKMMEDLYSDDTLPKFANVFHKDERPLYEVVPDILQPMLLSAKQEVETETEEPAPSSIFFAEEGLLKLGVEMLFDLAQQLDIPGSQDPEMLAAALINTYKLAGEHILDSGDEDAKAEAAELGGQLVANSYGTDDLDQAQKLINGQIKKNDVSAGVERGLLGGMV